MTDSIKDIHIRVNLLALQVVQKVTLFSLSLPNTTMEQKYHTKGWIRHNDNVWLMKPKDING